MVIVAVECAERSWWFDLRADRVAFLACRGGVGVDGFIIVAVPPQREARGV